MTPQSVDLILIPALIFVIFSIFRSVDSQCNQTCPTSPTTRLEYPFGFSEGCRIRLNCTKFGDILIGTFRVQGVTPDCIWVYMPPACDRPVETINQLYGQNYAPSLQNVFVLVNCSFGSPHDCHISPNEMDAMLRSPQSCRGTSKEHMSCISDGYKGVSELLEYVRGKGADCNILFSSITFKQVPLKTTVVKLAWWLEGSCQCDPNADCNFEPCPNGQTGYRCQCKKGFKGDGYPDGLGCQKDHGFIMKIIVFLVVPAGILLLGLCLFVCLLGIKGNFGSHKKVHPKDHGKEDLDLPLFELTTVVNATSNFSADNKLGEGGFGPVYKGTLVEGQEIAVKRLSKSSKQGLNEFKNEVIFIAKLQHRNLVKLMGCCIEGEEKLLIYEYLPNKSLDSFIFDPKQRAALDWCKRLHIINGIARGLLYLHQDSRLRIIHRDLKASNILLDNELNPKISDFGMARSFGGNETEANTDKVVGTHGYMPPEYVIDGLYSIKSDVFSFGVIVLEIVNGNRNRGFCHKDHCFNLLGHAWRLYAEGGFSELIDKSMGNSFDPSEARRLIHIGLLCVQQHPEDRPSMSSVLLMLGGEGILPQPKQPGFYIKRDLLEAKSSSSDHQICSINEVTMTSFQAR